MNPTVIEYSSLFEKTLNSDKRIIVHEGSARSSKTISILQCLIYWCITSKITVTACRQRLTWCKSTLIPDFLWVLDSHYKMFNPDNWNKSESIYRFDNGSEIAFTGLDESMKLRGRRQDIVYLNEGIETDQDSFQQLAIRTLSKIIICYNPSEEQHWLYDSVIPRNDCDFIKSTFKDNPFLSEDIKNEILRLEPTEENIKQGTADEVSWKIFGLGERAAHKGLIYSDTEICKELPPKEEWSKYFYGLDFGYTNDPTALVLVVVSRGQLYFKQMIYKRGLTNLVNPKMPEKESIEGHFIKLGIEKDVPIYADSSDPKSIDDLIDAGYYVVPTEKGPDSIINGITTVKTYKRFITEDSIDGIKEKNNYKWRVDKNGVSLNEPISNYDHFWDACRYAVFMEMRREYPRKGAVFPGFIKPNNPSHVEQIAFKEKRRSDSYFD